MTSYLFQKVAQNMPAGIQAGDQSRSWFRSQAQALRSVSANQLMAQKEGLTQRNMLGMQNIGQLCMFFYDPTTKEKLPYYDRFPVIFPIEMNKKGKNGAAGFLGINLHYLSPTQRAKLMDALYKVNRITNMNEMQKLKISYRILKGTASLRLFKPCIKHYLYHAVKSRFMIVEPKEWDFIVALPVERFESGGANGGRIGAPINKQRVWSDSMAKI